MQGGAILNDIIAIEDLCLCVMIIGFTPFKMHIIQTHMLVFGG